MISLVDNIIIIMFVVLGNKFLIFNSPHLVGFLWFSSWPSVWGVITIAYCGYGWLRPPREVAIETSNLIFLDSFSPISSNGEPLTLVECWTPLIMAICNDGAKKLGGGAYILFFLLWVLFSYNRSGDQAIRRLDCWLSPFICNRQWSANQ